MAEYTVYGYKCVPVVCTVNASSYAEALELAQQEEGEETGIPPYYYWNEITPEGDDPVSLSRGDLDTLDYWEDMWADSEFGQLAPIESFNNEGGLKG